MKGKDFDWQTNEFMLYCRTTQLREKSMMAYEQLLKLFERWCRDEMGIFTVDKVTENVIRRYISELQERGKYTFYRIDKQKKTNYPERRRDYRKPIRVIIHKSSHPFADTVKGWLFCCSKYCGKAGHTGQSYTGRCQKAENFPRNVSGTHCGGSPFYSCTVTPTARSWRRSKATSLWNTAPEIPQYPAPSMLAGTSSMKKHSSGFRAKRSRAIR